MESLEILANNLANASTGGYKTDREFYSVYAAAEAADSAAQGLSPEADLSPVIEKHWTDYSQGSLHSTGNPLNVALDGPGFFAANGPSGVVYTRNGNLRVNASGFLSTADGYPMRAAAGGTIQVTSNNPIEITLDGSVRQDGQDLGQLEVSDFPDPSLIQKSGLNYFLNPDPNFKPAQASAPIRQGHIEDSNVGTAESAIRLVSVMRQFESLQKAMNIAADMSRYAIEEVAKV